MSEINISFQWELKTELSIHTGLARAGVADLAVRQRNEQPDLRGEAVKGAIRESAERLLRWVNLDPSLKEDPDRSIPKHPVLQRLFAAEVSRKANSSHVRFWFRGAVGSQSTRFVVTSTAIELETGTAKDDTLRSIELWERGTAFDLSIRGTGGDWAAGGRDLNDLKVLLTSIVCTDSIGGGHGIGRGEIAIRDLQVRDGSGSPLPGLEDVSAALAGFIESDDLRSHLGGSADVA